MTVHSSMLHVRIDDETKEKAAATLGGMGLSVSDAVRLFLRRVVADQAFPFELKVPNAETRAAMAEAETVVRSRSARFHSSEDLLNDIEAKSGR